MFQILFNSIQFNEDGLIIFDPQVIILIIFHPQVIILIVFFVCWFPFFLTYVLAYVAKVT